MRKLDEIKYRALCETLEYRHTTLSKYYALCIAIADEVPLQLPNEIRNAFAHLSRVAISTNEADVDKEAKKAKDHLERASRDCLKLSLIVMQEKIETKLTNALVIYKFAAPNFDARLKAIKEERRKILIKEEAGDGNLVTKMEKLLNQAIALDDEITTKFGALKASKVFIFFRRAFWPILSAIVLLVGLISDLLNLGEVIGIK